MPLRVPSGRQGSQRARRSNAVTRVDVAASLVCAAVASAVVLAGDPAPTGSGWWDPIVVIAAVAAVVWASASAPWWSLLTAAGVVGASTSNWWVVAVAVAVGGLAGVIGVRRRSWAVARAASAAALLAAGGHAGAGWFHGATALCVCGSATLLMVTGVRRRQSAVRRRSYWLGGAVLAAVVIVGALAVVALLAARDDVREGEQMARRGLRFAQNGDVTSAVIALEQAADAFGRASSMIDSEWMQLSNLVPVLSQHQHAVSAMSNAGYQATTDAAAALDGIDVSRLRLDRGSFDLPAIRELEAPFARLAAAVERLRAELGALPDEWLIAPVRSRLVDLGDELAQQARLLGNASSAVRVAPSLLGEDGPRRYFVAFVTPAEARGLGGFMGNWAEITVTAGRIELTGFGTDDDLNEGGDLDLRRITGPQEFLDVYGQFGFVEPDGTTGRLPWKNITMPPDLTVVGPVMAELYPQSGGDELDGVFVVDPAGIAALMQFSGPVVVDGLQRPLTSATVEQFILKDQYLSMEGRTDRLDAIARAVVADVLSAQLPDPTVLARTFGPLVPERSVMAWSRHSEEQALFAALGMDGSLDTWLGDDEAGVMRNNGGGNKIDVYTTVEWLDTPTGGGVTYTNTAPTAGLPDYVIGNLVGLPAGSSRTRYTLYTRRPVVSITVNGVPQPVSSTSEQGLYSYSFMHDLLAGESFVVEWAFG